MGIFLILHDNLTHIASCRSVLSSLVECFPEVGVGNVDQGFCPLLHRFAVKIGYTIFGNNIMYVCPRTYHTSARTETGLILLSPRPVTEGSAIMGLPPSE